VGDVAIRAEGLGKKYRIGGPKAPYCTLREQLGRALAAPLRLLRRAAGEREGRTFWALRDVSFEVKRGEVVGLIGRNGAGKSTLLKILSRITEPTTGEVDLQGRVGSLLEVGTGFHPELTGRENLYLNGAILGMKRAEIARKFDKIVAFAEVERFIDTPVKHYSSGMYMRLAFAVAAFLEPEILLIDEVLAVGDARFQQKCLGRIGEVANEGRTVIFVSHQIPQVQRLCRTGVLLDGGQVVITGPITQVVGRYMTDGKYSLAERVWPDIPMARGDDVARLHAIRVVDDAGNVLDVPDIRRPVFIEVLYWQLKPQARPTVSLQFFNDQGVCLFKSNDFSNRKWYETPRSPGLYKVTCQIPANFLAEGIVFVQAAVCNYNPDIIHAVVPDAVSFRVADLSEGDGVRGPYGGPWPGVVRPWLAWSGELVGPVT
jgi:lipopolysaccharide transport system ATP-binding protein